MTKTIYNLKSYGDNKYSITKFDHDLEVESQYVVSLSECDCPQGERGKTCRHQRMLPMFLALARQDTEYFLDFDTKTWHRPLALEYEVEYHDLEVRRLSAAQKPAPTGVQVIPKANIDPVSPDTLTDVGPRADTATLPPTTGVSPAASVTSEVPCVVAEAAPIKRRRI